MIDLDYLLEIFSGQLQTWPRQYAVRKGEALADKVGLNVTSMRQRDMLIAMQQYIATTPAEQRCPCTRGPEPECEAVSALEVKAQQLAQLEADRLRLELRRQRIEQTWLDTKWSAEHLQATWNPTVLTDCAGSSSTISRKLSRMRLRIG